MPALGNCQRCGTFFCAGDRRDVDGVAYCAPCSNRPDVDWIEAYRQSLLGRRDGWAWLFGFSAIGYLIFSANLAANGSGALKLLAIPTLGSAITGGLFFFGKPVARILLVVSTLFWGSVQLYLLGAWGLLPTLFSLAFVATALTTPRNRLFFRLEVSRSRLKKDYQKLADNRLARNAFGLGLLALLLPVLGPLAIIAGVVAFKRVDPKARPPIGNGGYAIAGIALGVLSLGVGALWLTLGIRGQL